MVILLKRQRESHPEKVLKMNILDIYYLMRRKSFMNVLWVR